MNNDKVIFSDDDDEVVFTVVDFVFTIVALIVSEKFCLISIGMFNLLWSLDLTDTVCIRYHFGPSLL